MKKIALALGIATLFSFNIHAADDDHPEINAAVAAWDGRVADDFLDSVKFFFGIYGGFAADIAQFETDRDTGALMRSMLNRLYALHSPDSDQTARTNCLAQLANNDPFAREITRIFQVRLAPRPTAPPRPTMDATSRCATCNGPFGPTELPKKCSSCDRLFHEPCTHDMRINEGDPHKVVCPSCNTHGTVGRAPSVAPAEEPEEASGLLVGVPAQQYINAMREIALLLVVLPEKQATVDIDGTSIVVDLEYLKTINPRDLAQLDRIKNAVSEAVNTFRQQEAWRLAQEQAHRRGGGEK